MWAFHIDLGGSGKRFSDIGGVFSHNGLERKGVSLAWKAILGLLEKGFLIVTLQAFLDEKYQERVFPGLERKDGRSVCFVFCLKKGFLQ